MIHEAGSKWRSDEPERKPPLCPDCKRVDAACCRLQRCIDLLRRRVQAEHGTREREDVLVVSGNG